MWHMQEVLQRSSGVRMAFHGTLLMAVWSVMPVMLSAAYAQPKEPVPASGVPPGGIDADCRVALGKLPCQGIKQGSGRIRTCYEDNKGQLTPSCRQQVEEHMSEASAIMLMPAAAGGRRRQGRQPSRSLNTNVCAPAKPTSPGLGGTRLAES